MKKQEKDMQTAYQNIEAGREQLSDEQYNSQYMPNNRQDNINTTNYHNKTTNTENTDYFEENYKNLHNNNLFDEHFKDRH